MATEEGVAARDRILRVGAIERGKWVVIVDDDPTPLSEHSSREEAEAAARVHAETFGYPEIIVHELDGEQHTIVIDDVDPQPGFRPAPGDAAA